MLGDRGRDLGFEAVIHRRSSTQAGKRREITHAVAIYSIGFTNDWLDGPLK